MKENTADLFLLQEALRINDVELANWILANYLKGGDEDGE